jgi:hypothetical protein
MSDDDGKAGADSDSRVEQGLVVSESQLILAAARLRLRQLLEGSEAGQPPF